MATVNTTIPIDSALKQESQELFERFGLTLSAAVNLFLRQSVAEQALPFRVESPVYNEETRKAIEDARRGIGLTKAYRSAAELFAAFDAEELKQTRTKNLRGVLSEYANPALLEQEKGTWERAVVEKYG